MAIPSFPGFGPGDPFEDMRRLQEEVNRVFSSAFPGGRPAPAPAGFPAINAYASEHGIALTAELPGVKSEDLDVQVFRDTVTLRARRAAPDDVKAYHRQERRYGEFARTVNLPFRVDPERVEASMENGVLRLSLHRPEEDKPRRIKVSAG
jgi:HSP20 family protein